MSAGWVCKEIVSLPIGKTIERGDEVQIPWEGRFRFLRHVVNEAGSEWVDLYGGKAHHETVRSFRLDRITKVHKNRIMATKKERAAA